MIILTESYIGRHQVFTWYGATIEMDGTTETDYTADEVSYLFSNTYIMIAYSRSSHASLFSPIAC